MAPGFQITLAQFAQPYTFYSSLGAGVFIYFPVHQYQRVMSIYLK